jgi:enoyl-CoA hydratase
MSARNKSATRVSRGKAVKPARAAAKTGGAKRGQTLRTETAHGVRHIVLTRAAEYNTITPRLRDELARAVDAADADRDVRVILLRAEGPAFCAGYGLDWSTRAQARERTNGRSASPLILEATKPQAASLRASLATSRRTSEPARAQRAEAATQPAPWLPVGDPEGERRPRSWDSVADIRMMGEYVAAYMKLWYAKKPTIAAVQGWCIGGGTDLVLCADLIVAADDARFGYPPSRVWGTPTTAMWVYRMGLEQAKRYMLTGDEIPAQRAAEIGMILETVPQKQLLTHATALAERMAMVPTSQLVMLKLLCNQTAEQMGLASSRLLGTLFDGIARHTQEGLDFVARAQHVGFRQAVRERDDPFGDYGSRKR